MYEKKLAEMSVLFEHDLSAAYEALDIEEGQEELEFYDRHRFTYEQERAISKARDAKRLLDDIKNKRTKMRSQ